MNYDQPDFYHFGGEAIHLAKVAARSFKSSQVGRVLDLCCGCGVASLEFLRIVKAQEIIFCDVEKDFEVVINENVKKLKLNIPMKITICSFDDLNFTNYFDLIICNPPYYDIKKNRIGLNSKRNKAKFISLYETDRLILKIKSMLSANGSAYILNRDFKDYLITRHRLELIVDFKKYSIFKIKN